MEQKSEIVRFRAWLFRHSAEVWTLDYIHIAQRKNIWFPQKFFPYIAYEIAVCDVRCDVRHETGVNGEALLPRLGSILE